MITLEGFMLGCILAILVWIFVVLLQIRNSISEANDEEGSE